MNPFEERKQLLFTCIDGPTYEVVDAVLNGLNLPHEGTPRDRDGNFLARYFVKEISDQPVPAEVEVQTGWTPLRIFFWEPTNCRGRTVLMGNSSDGLSHCVGSLSQDNPRTWVNVRLYFEEPYPACFFEYYSNHRRVDRQIVAGNFEDGWLFVQQGPVQIFENLTYYEERLKKERLTPKIITEYLDKLGYDITDDTFWHTDRTAYLLWQKHPIQ